MSYKNDSLVVIVDKYSKVRGDSVADLYETYDRLRDISMSGSTFGSPGFGPTASFFMNLAKLVAPSSFMPVLGDSNLGLPGTSYFSSAGGSNIIGTGSLAAYGIGKLSNMTGLPTGSAASINSDYSIGGLLTGAASSIGSTLVPAAGVMSGLSAGYGQGTSLLLPAAGVISGIGGLVSSIGPYFGPFGLAAGIVGNLASGYGSAALNTYSTATGRILNNADVTLSNRVRNIETIVKQIDAQGQVLQKMLKDSVEVDTKALQNL
jgi:hypothetical protein